MRKLGVWLGALLLVLVASVEASAQRRVTGSVTSTTGEPIGNVVVNVQGTALGTYTTDDGKFVLNNVPNNAQTLVVRRIGYRRVLQPLAAGVNQIDIRLVKDVLELERQVVTGTTTSISSVNAANAVAQVSGEQLNKAPTPTIENALQGKIPGAVISQNSGAPGGGMQVQLRGTTSINANSSPLYVVDGVIVSNAVVLNGMNSITTAGGGVTNSQDQPVNRIADLNPADIENIEVLKGASAGAIYGSLASNGVIVITTKRGAQGRTTASITQRMGQFTLGHKLGLRCFGSAAEVKSAFGGTSAAAKAAGDAAAAEWQANNGVCHDFEDEFYGGNPLSYETDLSLRGGGGGTTFYVAGLAKRDNAIQKNSYYQKQSVSANLNQLIGSRVTLRANNEFMHSLTDRGLSGNDNGDITSPGDVFSATPTWIDLQSGIRNPYLPSGSNPFQNAGLVKLPEDVYRYIGSVNTTFSALSSARQSLDFSLLGGVDAFSYNGKVTSPPEAYFESNDGLNGTIVVNKNQSVNANLNLSARHKYTIGGLATATTSAGLRQQRRQFSLITNSGRNLPSGVSDVNFGVVQVVGETQQIIKDFAYFAQEELLAFNERLLITGGVNAERSSVNGDDKKFYVFPKAAASYRLPFLPPFTDELKVRMAFGKAGNQPPYGFKFTTLPISVYGGQLGARPSTIAGTPNIKPETSTELEGGLDAQFLGGRAAIDFTVFKKKVTDLILSASVANTSGFSTRLLNAGSLQNTGTEIGVSVTPIQRGNLSWVSRTTYANVDGRILSLGGLPCFNGGSFFSATYGAPYVCTGYSPTAVQARNGWDSTFVNGVYASRVRHISTYESAPNFNMGFSNEFNYGPVRLYGLLDWRSGGKVANLTNAYFDPVTNDGTGFYADTAKSAARIKRNATLGTSYLEDAGFLKLREISVSYLIPRRLTQAAFSSLTQDIRLEVSGRNLKTWTPYTGYDPEVSNFSNQNIGRFQDVTPYPPSRSVFVSISANF